MHSFTYPTLLVGLGLSCLFPALASTPAKVPDGLAASDWSSIRAAYEAGRHAFHAVEGGWQARNPGQQWLTRFDGHGFTARPDSGGWEWGLELRSYGFPGQERRHERPAMVTAQGQRLVWAWDACLEEWLVNDQRGLEHGFTVKKRPNIREVLDCGSPLPLSVPTLDCGSLLPLSVSQTAAGQPREGFPASQPHLRQQAALPPKRQQAAAVQGYLQFTLAVRGGLWPEIAADAKTVRFLDASGTAVLNYSGLKVWDATGRDLPAHFQATDSQQTTLRLLVDEREAVYPITIDPIAQQAYLKASQVSAGDAFGISVAVSGDTVVVGAMYEDSDAAGVNGDGTNDRTRTSGAAYVFVRSGNAWSQQAYLKASNPGVSYEFGVDVAVSGDTVVVGAHQEYSNATGVNGDGSNESAADAGAAYVFVRSGIAWSQQAYLKASNTGAEDRFGTSVAVSGDTVVVGAVLEDSNAVGVNGDGTNDSVKNSGAAYVFVRSGSNWSQQAYLKASNTGAEDYFGYSVSVSRDTVVVGALFEDSKSTGVNGDGSDNSNAGSGAAYVFVRSGSTWSQQAYLKASNTGTGDSFGQSAAVNGDTVVVGAPLEDSDDTGVNGNGNDKSFFFNSGAAYVFVRNGSNWSQQAYLKPTNTGEEDYFGYSVAVSGDTVVVGSHQEDSNAAGVNGDGTNDRVIYAGAAYAFVRSGSAWSQQAYLKASNPGVGDEFGCSVAVSGDTVVVGAKDENSSTTGVDSTPNEAASGAGAAYVFTGFDEGTPSLTPIERWRQQHFGITANSGNAANSTDPDRDGSVNLLEYGLVANPTQSPGAPPVPSISRVAGDRYLRTSFTRDPARNDVTIRVETAGVLFGIWTTVATSVNGAATTGAGFVSETDLAGGLKQVEVRDTVPTSAAARRFLRIVVE